jgi:hypothetical protein
MRIFGAFFLLFFIFACADLEKSDQIIQINQLIKKVDSLSIVLSQVNDSQFEKEIAQNQFLLSEFTSVASQDTISEVNARLIDKYSSYVKNLCSIQHQLKIFDQLLSDQGSIIVELKDDIKNGFGKRNSYNNSILFEEKKVKTIEKNLNSLKEKKVKTTIKLAILNPSLQEIIRFLKLKN